MADWLLRCVLIFKGMRGI
uniref:Uncharacterized protein n=1 Tax=Rhizophora mucronata TaxID=61149 RepID=A0A2P2QGX8_RHIMU